MNLYLEKEKIIEMYNKNISTYSIAKIYKCNASTIYRFLKKNNVNTVKTKSSYRKYIINENIFNIINTEEKAYFLGLLYADGGLCFSKKNKMISLCLKKEDEHIITSFRNFLYPNMDKPLKLTKDKKYSYIHIHSKNIFNSLEKLGCTRKKSLTLKFPTTSQVPNNLLNHFIRGYFDGDGGINYCTTHSRKYKQFKGNVNILGTYNFLFSLKKILLNIISKKISLFSHKHSKQCFKLTFSSKESINKFYNFIYINASIFLVRKKREFEFYFKSIKK